MYKIINQWRHSNFLKALVVLVSGQVLGQALTLVTLPILSRLYSPSDYGEFAVLSSASTILCSISQLGLSSAIMIPRDDIEAKSLISYTLLIQFILVTIFVVGVFATMSFIKIIDINMPYMMTILLLYALSLLTNLSNLLKIYMNRKKLYRALFWNSVIASLSTLFITIPLGLVGVGSWGFISAAFVSNIISIAQMISKANPFVSINSIDSGIRALKKHKNFMIYQYPANIVSTFSLQLPDQLMMKFFGSSALGSYSMSNRIYSFPTNLIASPINAIYFKTAVDYNQTGKDLASFTFNLITKIMLIAFVPLIILISFGEQIFSFVLGDQWREAGSIASILGIQFVLVFCANCTSYCRVSLGRQKINLVMSGLQLLIITISLLFGVIVYKGLIPTIICFVVGNTIYQIIDMTMNFHCLKKYVFRYLIFTLCYCTVACGISLALRAL